MKTLSIRSKLALTFGGLTLLIITVTGLSLYSLDDANHRFERYVNGVNARAAAAAKLRSSIDVRAISARNLVLLDQPADLAAEHDSLLRAHAETARHLARLTELAQAQDVPEDARRLIAEMARIERDYAPVAASIAEQAMRGQKSEAITRMNRECRPLLAALIAATDAYADLPLSRSASQVEAADRAYAQERRMLMGACLVALALAVLAGVAITRRLAQDLGAEPAVLRSVVGRVAAGDLSAALPLRRGDQSSVLAAVAHMQQALIGIVGTVRAGAQDVSIASEQISSGNNDLSSRTAGQASSLQQTAASMEQFSHTLRQNADSARQAQQLARQASSKADRWSARWCGPCRTSTRARSALPTSSASSTALPSRPISWP